MNEDLSEVADRLFARLAAQPTPQFYVPDLFYVECANILWKYVHRCWQVDQSQLKALLLAVAPVPVADGFRLIGLDHTPKPRLYAETVTDRSFVYQPTSIRLSRLAGRLG